MNETEKNKINRFMMDTVMSNSVYEVIRNAFLKNKGQRDLQILAAERIAIDLLEDAWKELLKFKSEKEQQTNEIKQVGL
jgi:hypothetical protein